MPPRPPAKLGQTGQPPPRDMPLTRFGRRRYFSRPRFRTRVQKADFMAVFASSRSSDGAAPGRLACACDPASRAAVAVVCMSLAWTVAAVLPGSAAVAAEAGDTDTAPVPTDAEAASMVRACGAECYDVIIADIRLPDMNGYELLVRLRELRDNVPLVLMTGFGYDPGHSIVKARQAGIDLVLFKPFRVDQLLDTVERALSAPKLA